MLGGFRGMTPRRDLASWRGLQQVLKLEQDEAVSIRAFETLDAGGVRCRI